MKRRRFLQFLGLAPAAPLVARIPAVQAAIAEVTPTVVMPFVVGAAAYYGHEVTQFTMSCVGVSENPSQWATRLTDFTGK